MNSRINPYILKKESFFTDRFFQDYYAVKWETSESSIKVITYSFPSSELKTTTEGVSKEITRNFSDTEKSLINNSIKAWDDAIDKIQFRLINDNSEADLTFGLTVIDEKGGIEDTWSASVTSDLFNYAIIEIEAVDISSNSDLTQKTLNSIG